MLGDTTISEAEFLDLVKNVWNASAKNVRARPITGTVFLKEILFPKLSRYSLAMVRWAMVAELAEGNPPLVKNVEGRCY
jgi:hypothetical protein